MRERYQPAFPLLLPSGKIQELRTELNSDKKDSKHAKKKIVLKKIVANMTMGNDMSPLFNDVVACMNIPLLEVKKMIYLFLINYSKSKPDMARLAVNAFMRDLSDTNPIIRALALRTMGYIQVDKVTECLCDQLRRCLSDKDPYVCKTAAIAVAKLFFLDKSLVENMGFLDYLRSLVDHENATVVANAVVTLCEIADRSQNIELSFEFSIANKLLTAINECSEWGQVYILESLLQVVPQDHNDAELLADRVLPRLQHANSAVVLAAVRVVMYLTNYIEKDDVVDGLYRKLGPPMVTLLHNAPEIQYIALRNIILLLQRRPDFLKSEIRVFFCKYNDAIYVKLAKLEAICRLVTPETVDQVLSELKEYATEVDVDFVRKSVRSIGRCAIKIDISADRCVECLVSLIQTKVNYVIQEAIVVIKVRKAQKYPNRYESIIGVLCENLEELDEVEAKASMIWIIGQYSDRIENANELLEQFMETFKEDAPEVQLALLSAVVKMFIKRPSAGQDLIPRILKWATEEVDNPDLRDRGFIYWRLLSTNPVAAKTVVLAEKPDLSSDADNIENPVLDELLLHISTLSSIYHRPPNTFIGGLRVKKLESSPARVFRNFQPPETEEVLSKQPNLATLTYEPNYSKRSQLVHAIDFDDGDTESIDAGLKDLSLANGTSNELDTSEPNLSIFQPSHTITNIETTVAPIPTPAPEIPVTSSPFVGAGMALLDLQSLLKPTPASQTPKPVPVQNNMMMPYGLNQSDVMVNAAPVLDPFALSSKNRDANGVNAVPNVAMSGGTPGVNPFSQIQGLSPVPSGFSLPMTVLLTPENGKGLGIEGTFCRRGGNPCLDIQFTNRSATPLSDFAILLNKNSFGLVPSAPLQIPAILPNQTSRASIILKPDNLQVAIKSTVGINYFQSQIPLYACFHEDGALVPELWLKMWREDVPASYESIMSVSFSPTRDLAPKKLEEILKKNNVFTVAFRELDGASHFFTATKLINGVLFLSDIKLDAYRNCSVSTRSFGQEWVKAYEAALSSLLETAL
ncbi:hypothetical protein HDU67_002761 [Dinochytrium kinnereticum]|nr:hypothetical protein HDU67_002761 [Dinochytrium kinnereticum]